MSRSSELVDGHQIQTQDRGDTGDVVPTHTLSQSQRREVDIAIIGNGPSSIFLSLILSGYWPYFTGSHPDPFLCTKLQENSDKSILEQDLEFLSEGLEGRSNNPIALLFDTLFRPDADIGEINASSLRWTHDPSKAVPHVVVGRGNPGGCWQFMDPDIRTLSLEQWLELPLYSFQDWRREHGQGSGEDTSGTLDCNRRASCGEVAHYYADYVNKMGLAGNFVSDTEVYKACNLEKLSCPSSSPQSLTCLSPSSSLSSPASPKTPCLGYENPDTGKVSWDQLTDLCSQISDPEDCGVFCCQRRVSKWKWYVRGTQRSRNGLADSKLSVFSRKLVLACGVHGNQRHLKVPGEKDASFLSYNYPDFAKRIGSCDTNATVLVVGAGLSAADSVLLVLKHGMKVVHVFDKDPFNQQLIFSRMPEKVYRDYKHVHRLMQGCERNPNYTAYAQGRVSEFRESGFTVQSYPGLQTRWHDMSLGVVVIGTDAELGFLPDYLLPKLGRHSDVPINAKHNAMDVNVFSFVTEACPHLYAVGSLMGDNFVRFGVGSALGAAQHILQLST